VKALLLAAMVAICDCCGGPARAQDTAKPPEVVQPGPETEQPQADYYVLTPEQLAQVNAMFARLREIVDAQRKEIEDLREKNKPIGNCG
jgi:hypothetical protein